MDLPSTSVIVCAYAWERLPLTLACLDQVQAQVPAPAEVLVVVDHNPGLADEIAAQRPSIRVIRNDGQRGLSTARNVGIAASGSDVIAFVDDDAVPADGWLAGLLEPFGDPTVAVVGGRAEPDWEGGRAPGWMPPEFLWVVGCSYRGQVTDGPARNPIGCSMAFRRSAFEVAGLFDPEIGRLGTIPLGCEETEICIRLTDRDPRARVVLTSASLVSHHVPEARQHVRYFVRRCFYEGVSKAVIRRLAGPAATGSEMSYTTKTLPAGVARAIAATVAGPDRMASIGRAIAIPVGLLVTVAGFTYGGVVTRRSAQVQAGPHDA